VALSATCVASAQILPPPPSWSLNQNDPDPFCGSTMIQFGLAQVAHVQLAVWNADMTSVVRWLVDGDLPAGLFQVIWDGRDNNGAKISNGQYSYRLIAEVAGSVVYDHFLVAHQQCEVPVSPGTWSALKGRYLP
jgi:hypothetical protein